MDIGEPELNIKNEDKNDLNDIWTKSMKVINSIEDLIDDANQVTSSPKFIKSRSSDYVHLSVHSLSERELIPDGWIKFILAENNNNNMERRLSVEIERLMKELTEDELDNDDKWITVAIIEKLTIIWLWSIKVKQGKTGDLIHLLMQFSTYIQRSLLDKVIFCGVILCAIKIIEEVFNTKELTLLKFVNITPFMLARNSPKIEIGDKIWSETMEKNENGRTVYSMESHLIEKFVPSSYEAFWIQGSHMNPRSLMQNSKFNNSLAGLSLLCAVVGRGFAENNLKKHLESFCGKYNDQMSDEKGTIDSKGAQELIHAICVFDCFGQAFGQTRDKEAKKMLKGLRKVLEAYSETESGSCQNKVQVIDHATFQLVMMGHRVEAARKSIFEHIEKLAKQRKLPSIVTQLVDEIKTSA